MPYTPTKSIAQSSFKSVSAELANLNPSAVITFFEIDVSDVMESNNIANLGVEADAYGVTQNVQDNILRFHNSINVFSSFLKWQGKTYYPAPIQGEGFEISSRGTLPYTHSDDSNSRGVATRLNGSPQTSNKKIRRYCWSQSDTH